MKRSTYRACVLAGLWLGILQIMDAQLPETNAQPAAVSSTVSNTTLPADGSIKGWPAAVKAGQYVSPVDQTVQPTLYYWPPPGERKVPLLVALHTWSNNYQQAEPAYAVWCIARGWAMVHPNFRGPNNQPEACGSEKAVQDILDAVEFAKTHAKIDPDRIYLIGVSGGGMASLLMAGRAPEIWAGVSAWCPIYDLKDWHRESVERNSAYAQTVEKICGGPPGKDSVTDGEYQKRSPSAWMEKARGVAVDINAGIMDGHKGSVPIGQSLHAFNALAVDEGRISEEDIARMQEKPEMPAPLLQMIEDPLYRRGKVLYRKISGNARVTIFQGGHTILAAAGLAWLEQQRRGQPPVWDITETPAVNLNNLSIDSGK